MREAKESSSCLVMLALLLGGWGGVADGDVEGGYVPARRRGG
jgi:hypothetical protein